MPYIMNALETGLNTQAHGKWFKWTPLQIKEIQNPDLALFFEQKRGEDGLISIPEHVMEMDRKSLEFLQIIEDKRKEGVRNRINKLDYVIKNLEQSLRYDLEKSDIKADPLTFASKGEVAAYKERATLVEFERLHAVTPGDEIRKIKAQMEGTPVSGNSGSTNSGTNPTGRPNTVKSA